MSEKTRKWLKLSIDVTAITAYFHEHEGKDVAYFRLCSSNIGENSIITVNEPIE